MNIAAFTDPAPAITYWTIDGSQLEGLFNAINTNVNAAIPYGLAIMGTFIGVSVLKRIIYTFL